MSHSLHDRIVTVVSTVLKIDPAAVSDDLAAGDVPSWDSLGHVTLLQALEQEFQVTFDIDDALAIESVIDMKTVLSRISIG